MSLMGLVSYAPSGTTGAADGDGVTCAGGIVEPCGCTHRDVRTSRQICHIFGPVDYKTVAIGFAHLMPTSYLIGWHDTDIAAP